MELGGGGLPEMLENWALVTQIVAGCPYSTPCIPGQSYPEAWDG